MKLGVIGAGGMGSAIVNGCIKMGTMPSDIMVYDHSKRNISERLGGVQVCSSTEKLAGWADTILLAVKPNSMDGLLTELRKWMNNDQVIVSVAAGLKITDIEAKLGNMVKIVRVMPNTPAMINEAMSGLCKNANVSDEEFSAVFDLFRGIGRAQEVDESLMDVVTGLSGSAPAFVYMFIEALADGAVMKGMPRSMAYTFAAQTVFGSAGMVLETGRHPGELKDMVTSPGGTTISGIRKLEKGAFRSCVMEAVVAATERSECACK